MSPDRGSDLPSPAEQQLLRYLHALREDAPEPDSALVGVVSRRARWQAEVRPVAEVTALLFFGMAGSVRIMAGTARP